MTTSTRKGGSASEQAAGAPVHLFFGDDEYVVTSRAREIINSLCPESEQALSLEIINGLSKNQDEAATAVSSCIDALNTVGLFGGGKTVWLRDANFFSTAVSGEKVKSSLSRLTDCIKRGLGDGTYLVISAGSVDKRSSFYKACNSKGMVYEHTLPQRTEEADASARERASEIFRVAGVKASPSAMEQFIQKTGADTRVIRQEAEKLIVYLGDRRELTPDDVMELVTSSRESPAWDLNEALGSRRFNDALKILRRLISQKEPPIKLIIGMENHFQLLVLLKVCQSRGWLKMEGSSRFRNAVWHAGEDMDRICAGFTRDPRKMHPYRVLKLLEQSQNFTVDELVAVQEETVRTHEMMVQLGIPQELLLEMLAIRICRPKQVEIKRPVKT